MARGFQPARRMGTTVPLVQEIQYATGQTFTDRALVLGNTDGEVEECGADPDAVLGVALNGVGTLPGYNLSNSNVTNVITGRRQKVSVAIADDSQEFTGRGVN